MNSHDKLLPSSALENLGAAVFVAISFPICFSPTACLRLDAICPLFFVVRSTLVSLLGVLLTNLPAASCLQLFA